MESITGIHMTKEEIKLYIKGVIATGDKLKIQAVLKRYLEWQKEQGQTKNDAIQNALEVFGGKVDN